VNGSKSSSHALIGVLVAVAAGVLAPLMLLFALLGGMMLSGCGQSDASGGDAVAAGQGTANASNASYRAPEHSDDPVAEQVATFMEATANDDSHGYSQNRRGGNPDYDCSSLVYFAVRHAGVAGLPAAPFNTMSEGQALTAVGFAHLTWSGDFHDARQSLKRGDIVVNPTEHTEVYVGGGLFAGARHATPSGTEDGMPGDQGKGADQEIGIGPYLDAGLTQVYRHDPNAKSTPGADGGTASAAQDTAQCDADGASVLNAAAVTNGSVGQAKDAARQLVRQQWPDDADRQYSCLEQLWDHESGWRADAENPGSGAYGIPQALPADKMSSAGSDWKTNATTQIKWGLGYIKGRPDYGTPCAAWSLWQSRSPHWY
jgi:hypothetical protein